MDDILWTNMETEDSEHTCSNNIETAHGDNLSIVLAILPDCPNNPDRNKFTLSLVNDSNYYLSFCIFSLTDGRSELLCKNCVDPNTSLDLVRLSLKDFENLKGIRLQAFAFKINKLFAFQPMVNRVINFTLPNLRKSSYYKPGVYFDEPVKEVLIAVYGKMFHEFYNFADIIIYSFNNNDAPKADSEKNRPKGANDSTVGRRRELKKNDSYKSQIKSNQKVSDYKVLEPLEIDLHIHELVDSTVGMDNFTMLQLQLEAVRKTMESHKRRVGQKIIFIHGKGDGVLRKEVRKLLSGEYPSSDIQDASFLKYGYGATQVTIRQNHSSR
ncbi:MAG: DUF2027 domain-containing protein [Muribaculaceae bacterium]|nr:DUF2027 domain-containing protein [Muribaculaceae bacterium]